MAVVEISVEQQEEKKKRNEIIPLSYPPPTLDTGHHGWARPSLWAQFHPPFLKRPAAGSVFVERAAQ